MNILNNSTPHNTQINNCNIAVIGECMLELSNIDGQSSQNKKLGFGGDTLNTCMYLARAGTQVHFVSALGDDPQSHWMLSQWHKEGVNCEYVNQVAGRLPGLYMIETDEEGERSFYYWRDSSPARELFDHEQQSKTLFSTLMNFSTLYLSGVTLSLYNDSALERLLSFLNEYRQQGGVVVFDSNFRIQRWPNLLKAQAIFRRFYQQVDVALPTLEDDLALFQLDSKDQLQQLLLELGVKEMVIKEGADGCWIIQEDSCEFVAALKVQKVVDTTGAGDSFNAGFLNARLKGATMHDSAMQGHFFGAQVIQQRGAIVNFDQS